MLKRWSMTVVVVTCLYMAVGVATAQGVNYYLHVDDVEGSCADQGREGWIKAMGFSQEVKARASGGLTAFTPLGMRPTTGGSAAAQPLLVSKRIDKSSPVINQQCMEGTEIREVVLELVEEGSPTPFMVYRLTNARVTQVSVGVDEGGIPVEELSLTCSTVRWTYHVLRADGRVQRSYEGGWDFTQNKPL